MHPWLWGSSNTDQSSLPGQQVMRLNGHQLPKIRPFELSNKEIFCQDVIKLAVQLNASVLFRENRLPVSLGIPGSVDPMPQGKGPERKTMKKEGVSSQGGDSSSHGDVDATSVAAPDASKAAAALSGGSDSAQADAAIALPGGSDSVLSPEDIIMSLGGNRDLPIDVENSLFKRPLLFKRWSCHLCR